jgi:hypothetical protein
VVVSDLIVPALLRPSPPAPPYAEPIATVATVDLCLCANHANLDRVYPIHIDAVAARGAHFAVETDASGSADDCSAIGQRHDRAGAGDTIATSGVTAASAATAATAASCATADRSAVAENVDRAKPTVANAIPAGSTPRAAVAAVDEYAVAQGPDCGAEVQAVGNAGAARSPPRGEGLPLICPSFVSVTIVESLVTPAAPLPAPMNPLFVSTKMEQPQQSTG